METLLPNRRPASKHPRRAKRSPRGSQAFCTRAARASAASQNTAIAPLGDDNKNPQRRFTRNQQYSITAVSDGGGAVVERYAYSAYGQVTIADASGSEISNSANSNRYTYTGREWDEGLSLYHYRARMYAPLSGRFISRDPLGYVDGFLLLQYVLSNPVRFVDFSGSQAVESNELSAEAELPDDHENWACHGGIGIHRLTYEFLLIPAAR